MKTGFLDKRSFSIFVFWNILVWNKPQFTFYFCFYLNPILIHVFLPVKRTFVFSVSSINGKIIGMAAQGLCHWEKCKTSFLNVHLGRQKLLCIHRGWFLVVRVFLIRGTSYIKFFIFSGTYKICCPSTITQLNMSLAWDFDLHTCIKIRHKISFNSTYNICFQLDINDN